MNDIILYGIILVAIVGVVFGIIYAKRKFNIKDEEIEFAVIILKLIDHIVSKFNFKDKDNVSKIMTYVIEAFEFTLQFEKIDELDHTKQKELIFNRAKEICIAEGIEIDTELDAILSEAVDFVIENYLKK